jgi:hypothetical protein
MPQHKKGNSTALAVTSSDGPVADDAVLAIFKCNASIEGLEVVATYLQGEGSAVDRLGHPMMDKVGQL